MSHFEIKEIFRILYFISYLPTVVRLKYLRGNGGTDDLHHSSTNFFRFFLPQ
jgi:hypothetical protein